MLPCSVVSLQLPTQALTGCWGGRGCRFERGTRYWCPVVRSRGSPRAGLATRFEDVAFDQTVVSHLRNHMVGQWILLGYIKSSMNTGAVRTYQGRRWLEQLGQVAGTGGAEGWRPQSVLGVGRPSPASNSVSRSAARVATSPAGCGVDPLIVAGWAAAAVVT